MKHKNRFSLPLLALVSFGMATSSLIAANYNKSFLNNVEATTINAKKTGKKDNHIYLNATDGSSWRNDSAWFALQSWTDSNYNDNYQQQTLGEITVLGSSDHIYTVCPSRDILSLKFCRMTGDTYQKVMSYGNLNYVNTNVGGANVWKQTTYDAGNWDYDSSADKAYNIYPVTMATSGATSATIQKVGGSDSITSPNFGYAYSHDEFILTATGPNGWNFAGWSFSGWAGSEGASYVDGYSSMNNPSRITGIKDHITITATYTNPWNDYSMEYSFDNENWESMTAGTHGTTLRKFTADDVSYNYGDTLYIKYNDGEEDHFVDGSSMGLVGGEGANNLSKTNASSRPTVRYDNVTGDLSVRVTHDGSSLHFWCWAEGITDNNNLDGWDLIINSNYLVGCSYQYNNKSPRADKREWYNDNVELYEGDTITRLNEKTSGGEDYGAESNISFIATDQGSNGTAIEDGVVTVQKTGNYKLYLVSGGSDINCIYTDRLTRIVNFYEGETLVHTEEFVTKNTPVSDPGITKEGYDLVGWYTDPEFSEVSKWSFSSNVTTDLNLYAKWSINSYTITFEYENGEEISSSTQNYATAIVAPADPVRTGYEFLGWDPAVPNVMPARDITCVTQWRHIEYSITYYSDDEVYAEQKYHYNDDLDTPTPAKEGFRFGGWYFDPGFNAPLNTDKMPAQNLNLYAKWSDGLGLSFDAIFAERISVKIAIPEESYTEDELFDEIKIISMPNCNNISGIPIQNVSYTENGANKWSLEPVDPTKPEGAKNIVVYVDVNAAQMQDYVEVAILNGGTPVRDTERIRVVDIIRTFMITCNRDATGKDLEGYKLALSILYYGDAMQLACGYKTGRLPTGILSELEKGDLSALVAATEGRDPVIPDPGVSGVGTKVEEYIKGVSISAGMETYLSTRFTINCPDSIENSALYTAEVTSGSDGTIAGLTTKLHPDCEDRTMTVIVRGIQSFDISKHYILTIKRGETIVYRAQFSVSHFLKKMYEDDRPGSLPYNNVALGIQMYGEWADTLLHG